MVLKNPKQLQELGPFQLIILTLSLFVLGLLAAELIFDLPSETVRVLGWIDNLVCCVFFADFVIRFRRAESKLQFMKWGWIDLLSSIPEIEVLRWGRVFRVFRVLRLLRAIKSVRLIFELLFKSRTSGGMVSVFTITFLMLSLSSAGILVVESGPDSNIRSAEDAIWWGVTTITTVGYGDHYPVTLAGRCIAVALMITGVGLFGTLSGVIASYFLGDKKASSSVPLPEPGVELATSPGLAPDASREILAQLDMLQKEVAALRNNVPNKDVN